MVTKHELWRAAGAHSPSPGGDIEQRTALLCCKAGSGVHAGFSHERNHSILIDLCHERGWGECQVHASAARSKGQAVPGERLHGRPLRSSPVMALSLFKSPFRRAAKAPYPWIQRQQAVCARKLSKTMDMIKTTNLNE